MYIHSHRCMWNACSVGNHNLVYLKHRNASSGLFHKRFIKVNLAPSHNMTQCNLTSLQQMLACGRVRWCKRVNLIICCLKLIKPFEIWECIAGWQAETALSTLLDICIMLPLCSLPFSKYEASLKSSTCMMAYKFGFAFQGQKCLHKLTTERP